MRDRPISNACHQHFSAFDHSAIYFKEAGASIIAAQQECGYTIYCRLERRKGERPSRGDAMAGNCERDRVDTRDAEKKLISSRAEVANTNYFAMKFGADFDYRLHLLVALHLATFEYKRVWTPQDTFLPVRNGMSMRAGIVLR